MSNEEMKIFQDIAAELKRIADALEKNQSAPLFVPACPPNYPPHNPFPNVPYWTTPEPWVLPITWCSSTTAVEENK